jgi:hypothetical protein
MNDKFSGAFRISGAFRKIIPRLKVLTNDKRGGVRVTSFDRPPFKLLSRKFSKDSVQAPSCERHKTLSEHLILLFAINY